MGDLIIDIFAIIIGIMLTIVIFILVIVLILWSISLIKDEFKKS